MGRGRKSANTWQLFAVDGVHLFDVGGVYPAHAMLERRRSRANQRSSKNSRRLYLITLIPICHETPRHSCRDLRNIRHRDSGRQERPNILLVMVDDMGFSDLRCYGSEISTPTLDSLAADGMRFSQFYNTAKCHSSRVSLLTGRRCKQAGDINLSRAVTIPKVLKPAPSLALKAVRPKYAVPGKPDSIRDTPSSKLTG